MKLALYLTAVSLFLNIATAEYTEHGTLDSFVSGLYRTSVKLAESSKVSSPIGFALSLEALRSILAADETELAQAIKNITGNEGKMSDLMVLVDEIRKKPLDNNEFFDDDDIFDSGQKTNKTPDKTILGLYAYIPEGQSCNPEGMQTLVNSGHLVSRIDTNDPDAACSTINNQVSQDTDGKISEIIDPSIINLETSLILLNTLYLKHKWLGVFADTTNNFKINERTYLTRFLKSKRRLDSATLSGFTILGFTLWSGYRMIKIPSRCTKYSLYIKLPTGWSQPEPITEDDIRKFQQTSEYSLTDFCMPHVSLNGNLDCKKSLGVFGDTNARTTLTDKPWMAGGIRQRIKVELDHRGIEAAAATSRNLKGSSGRRQQIVIFHVTRPFTFMYALTSSHTSLPIPLFTGTVDSPNDLKLANN